MFFIFGIRNTAVFLQALKISCGHCQTNSVQLLVYQNYFHLFWIPFFPLWKSTQSQCSHCKKVCKAREFDSALQQSAKEVKKQPSTPWWTWSLSFVLLLLILSITVLVQF